MAPFDVAVVGSGFAGSLLALILAHRGRRVLLIERGAHPRFTIGESSTPAADLILADLSRKYALPRLAPLSEYGAWKRSYADLKCGRKRGFSYFHHAPGEDGFPRDFASRRLLVAASKNDTQCDTHWLRADVDAFLAHEACREGAELWQHTRVRSCREVDIGWRLELESAAEKRTAHARFLVDATGSSAFGRQWLGLRDTSAGMRTWSRAIYSHFERVTPWSDRLEQHGVSTKDHPFDCDAAALHHVLDDAWMWVLRFDHHVVSAGLAIGPSHGPPPNSSVEAEWTMWLGRFPVIEQQFQSACLVDPPGMLIRTERLQRRASAAVGRTWAALPHTFGFVDPLHSTGIAHSLLGVERLLHVLGENALDARRREALARYESQLREELDLIDELVHVAYATTTTFPLFVCACMLYFVAAITYEARRQGGVEPQDAFLCAEDGQLRQAISEAARCLQRTQQSRPSPVAIRSAEAAVRKWIEPFNTAGLLDPDAGNMYRHTGIERPSIFV